MNESVSVIGAFIAGVVSFVSPCVLPLVPSYLSFLTGTSLEDLKSEGESLSAGFHVYYPVSTMHTWLLTDVELDETMSDVTLADWLKQMANGDPQWGDAD